MWLIPSANTVVVVERPIDGTVRRRGPRRRIRSRGVERDIAISRGRWSLLLIAATKSTGVQGWTDSPVARHEAVW